MPTSNDIKSPSTILEFLSSLHLSVNCFVIEVYTNDFVAVAFFTVNE